MSHRLCRIKNKFKDFKELSGAVVSRLDYCEGDPGSIPAEAEFPTGILVLGDNT